MDRPLFGLAIIRTHATSLQPSDRLHRQMDRCLAVSEIGYSTEPGVVVCRARYAAASARRATSSFERIEET
jgi:hypothetical protein